MTHADDDGMVMPPRLAPQHIVLLPVIRDEADRDALMGYVQEIADALRLMKVFDRLIEVVVDDRDLKPGEKGWSWVKKGIPIRAEIGKRELDEQTVFMARRDTGEKESVSRDLFLSDMTKRLESIQADMLERAKAFRTAHSEEIDSIE